MKLDSKNSNIGEIYSQNGKSDKALNMLENALEVKKRIGDRLGTSITYGQLAGVYRAKGNTAKSIEYFNRSLKILESTGDKKSTAVVYANLGGLYQDIGESDSTRINYEKARDLFEIIGDVQHNQPRQNGLMWTRRNRSMQNSQLQHPRWPMTPSMKWFTMSCSAWSVKCGLLRGETIHCVDCGTAAVARMVREAPSNV